MAGNRSAQVDSNQAFAENLRDLLPGRDPHQATVLDLFRTAVDRTPDAVAISTASTSLTYTKLWNYAASFRARLAARGFGPGDMVGIAAERSVATVAAILGVLMCGGCYVPVDSKELPSEIVKQLAERNRLHSWFADADAFGSRNSALFAGKSVLQLEDVPLPAGESLVEIPAPAINPENPCYVMFTSGSTGLPKGVVVPHRAVARLVLGQDFLRFGPEQTFLLHSPLSFDASTLELWGALLHGGRLAIAPAGRLGLDDYADVLVQQKVTTLWLTAAMFHLAAEHAPEMFAPLTQLIFGGDVIAPRHVERVRQLYPGLHMVNGYGPTENTTFTCCYVVPAEYRAEGSLPIGFPIARTTVQIFDENLDAVAAGEAGELVAGGAGVALGYLEEPVATAERFLPDTTSPEQNARLYRTGDFVRQRQDGAIEFLGRLDSQVKIAGHRVELGAIEHTIASAPRVADAAVVVLTPTDGEKQLAACVSLSNATDDAEAQLRAWLNQRLPHASIPQHWMFLERLPITANGKLDRNTLRDRCQAQFLTRDSANPSAQTASREALSLSETERTLQQLWAMLLNRASVGMDDNFFDLGGTSLLWIEMHARLKSQFVSVPSVVEIFALPTPRALAERLYAGRGVLRPLNAGEERGQRQRAAMLARRSHASKAANVDIPVGASQDGSR